MAGQEATLQGLLRFGDADLAANRDGRLSPGQVGGLTWSGVWRLVVGPALLIAGLVLAFSVPNATVVAVLMVLVFGGVGLYLTWMGFAFLVDAVDGQVAFVTAPLTARVVHGKSTSYFADCGPVSKLINARTYDGLPRGLTCHLYYAPGSRSLLAIEPASESEPKPAHPFGPDSAHVWDRLRVSWVAVTVGVIGLLIAAHAVIVAHPAHAIPVEGTVSYYYERHGKSVHRDLYLQGDPNSYSPYAETDYSPPMPAFDTLTGRSVVLFVDEGTRDVLAINDGEQLHASDWYLNPDHEKTFETVLGVISGALSLLVVGSGVVAILFGQRIAAGWRQSARQALPQPSDPLYASTPMYSMPNLYAPPSVRPWYRTLVGGLALVLVLAVVGAAFGLLVGVSTRA